MCYSNAFVQAFFATRAWLPTNHLISDGFDKQNPNVLFSEGEQIVNIQHFKEYEYTEKVTSMQPIMLWTKMLLINSCIWQGEFFLAKQESYNNAEKLKLQQHIDDTSTKIIDELEFKSLLIMS